MSKISILTAVFNRQNSIARALESIKSQTFRDIECVVVDGESTDGTMELLPSILGPQDKLLSEPDKGAYDALNKGLLLASGEVIGLLHSDDYYEDRNVLSRVMEIFETQNVDLVYGDASFFNKGDLATTVRKYKSPPLSKKNLAWGQMPAHPSMFFRKEIYRELGGFKLEYKIAADYEFLCRLLVARDIRSVYLPQSLVRMQVGGLSTSGIKSHIVINKEVQRALKESGIYSNYPMILSKYPKKLFGLIAK